MPSLTNEPSGFAVRRSAVKGGEWSYDLCQIAVFVLHAFGGCASCNLDFSEVSPVVLHASSN